MFAYSKFYLYFIYTFYNFFITEREILKGQWVFLLVAMEGYGDLLDMGVHPCLISFRTPWQSGKAPLVQYTIHTKVEIKT